MYSHEKYDVIRLQDCKDCLLQAAVSHIDFAMTAAVVLGLDVGLVQQTNSKAGLVDCLEPYVEERTSQVVIANLSSHDAVLGFIGPELQCNFLSPASAAVPHHCMPTTSVGCRLFGSPTQESMFVQDRIVACPHNESSWNYLRGLLSLPDMKQALVLQELAAFCVKVSTAYCWMLVMATAPQISV